MASLTRWRWVWVNSRRWWWTGKPGVLQFMGSQTVGQDWATELNWTELERFLLLPVGGAVAYTCVSPPAWPLQVLQVTWVTAAGVTGTWVTSTTSRASCVSRVWGPQTQSWWMRRQVAGVPDAQLPWPRRFSGQETGVLYKLPDQCWQAPWGCRLRPQPVQGHRHHLHCLRLRFL